MSTEAIPLTGEVERQLAAGTDFSTAVHSSEGRG
jgi:hypothetical protein